MSDTALSPMMSILTMCNHRNDLCGALKRGSCLTKGDCLSNGMGALVHQYDSNIVAYNESGVIFSTNTDQADCDTTHFCFQHDGNLVLYCGSEPLWSSAHTHFEGMGWIPRPLDEVAGVDWRRQPVEDDDDSTPDELPPEDGIIPELEYYHFCPFLEGECGNMTHAGASEADGSEEIRGGVGAERVGTERLGSSPQLAANPRALCSPPPLPPPAPPMPPPPPPPSMPPSEFTSALVKLFESAGGDQWVRTDRWFEGEPCIDEWDGVRCCLLADRNTTTIANACQLTPWGPYRKWSHPRVRSWRQYPIGCASGTTTGTRADASRCAVTELHLTGNRLTGYLEDSIGEASLTSLTPPKFAHLSQPVPMCHSRPPPLLPPPPSPSSPPARLAHGAQPE